MHSFLHQSPTLGLVREVRSMAVSVIDLPKIHEDPPFGFTIPRICSVPCTDNINIQKFERGPKMRLFDTKQRGYRSTPTSHNDPKTPLVGVKTLCGNQRGSSGLGMFMFSQYADSSRVTKTRRPRKLSARMRRETKTRDRRGSRIIREDTWHCDQMGCAICVIRIHPSALRVTPTRGNI